MTTRNRTTIHRSTNHRRATLLVATVLATLVALPAFAIAAKRSRKAPAAKVAKKRASKRSSMLPPRGASKKIPFQPGERLTYEISWLGVPVGTAVFEVAPSTRYRGKPTWKFRMRASTNKYADAIYKVRDDMHSWASANLKRSVHFRKSQHEGNYHREVKLHFDRRRGKIVYENQWRKYPPRKLYKDSYDPLALVYGFRRLKVREPGGMEMSATDGLKTIRAEVTIHGKEDIKVGTKTWRCWKVQPDLKDVGGIFKRSKNAKMIAWFSDDEHRLPVRLESEVLVGSFVATLVKVEGLKGE